MVKNRSTLWYSALIVGWGFDILYWEKPIGISFAVHLLLLLGGLLFLSKKEEKRPISKSLPLMALIMLFSTLGFLREEPFTRVLNHLLSLGFLALFLLSFRGGRWYAYSLSDYIVGAFRMFLNSISLPFNLLTTTEEEPEESREAKPKQTGWKKSLPYLRGILLALPIVAILASMLSAADPIFSEWLQDIIELLRLEKLPEYIVRLVLISIWTFLTAGLLMFALYKSEEEKLVGEDQPWPPRFLGFTETTIILGAINLLLFSFVTIQFKYFFGGEKNISLDGYTYSEYARRGFGELLGVAFFTLFVIIVLSDITKRENKKDRVTFSLLTGAMTAFIGVILVSSLQRLALYEAAYGFTRLRTYSHLCVLWIGILFLVILVLEIFQKWRYFTLATTVAIAGFVLTMNAVNIDGFILQKNIQRLQVEGAALDTYYLKELSNDAIPKMIQLANDPALTDQEKTEIHAVLACRADELEDGSRKWQSFLVPFYLAKKALNENKNGWGDARVVLDENKVRVVKTEYGKYYCGYSGWD
ncbi:MAG: DUF4173 domain-containing protein [Anaerolineales bacterium]|nr:DUF4173 domain-containing protein [Anaerolineales bacterium]